MGLRVKREQFGEMSQGKGCLFRDLKDEETQPGETEKRLPGRGLLLVFPTWSPCRKEDGTHPTVSVTSPKLSVF